MVYVFTEKSAPLKKVFPKTAEFAEKPVAKHAPSFSDISYFDITGLSAAELKTLLTKVKKACGSSPWGVIDTKGTFKDITQFFIEGASDYIGPALLKEEGGLDIKRITSALQWRKALAGSASLQDEAKLSEPTDGFIKSGVKFPAASSFPGWKKMTAGKTMPFYLLYCSLQGNVSLETRLGEKVLSVVHKKFLTLLNSYFKEAEGLLWVDTGKDCLFLLPPRAKCAEAAIKACMRMIVASPLLVLETLGVNIPANFVFALHYGQISYKPPGKTGTVVSDAVNSVFHLGAKKAEPGRFTVSGEVPDATIPKILYDFFIPSGEYEGRKIWNTRKFKYEKAWV